MKFLKSIFLLIILWQQIEAFAQDTLVFPGYDKLEFIEMMKVTSRFGDSTFYNKIGEPEKFHQVYRSPIMGLDNLWDLWIDDNGVALICLRGTTSKNESWLENFYAVLTPAKGSIVLKGGRKFDYNLSRHPEAAVHAGWLLGMASMAGDIQQKLDSCYQSGIKNFIIHGHSQGGALSILLTAHLLNLKAEGKIPEDIIIKTIASAAPKPGNLHFAYDYEARMRSYGITVVNAADWVPEVPMSIQTLNDFNPTNPFKNADDLISKQKLGARLVMKKIYNKLNGSTREAHETYQKYLGLKTYPMVQKVIAEYSKPEFFDGSNFTRAGQYYVLWPESDYFEKYPDNDATPFVHHMMQPYIYLAERN
ncbi:MAG: lipase family protein [Flavobacteriales bacterium]